jgi:hypothetical protein
MTYLPDKTHSLDKIQIIDNFFSQEIIEKIVKYYDKVYWKCNCLIRPNADTMLDKPFWDHELIENYFFRDILKEEIEKYFGKKFKVVRIYSVGQTYEQNSNFHYDSQSPNNYTLCLYINENVLEEDEGYFYVKLPKYVISVNPLFNRAVFFPSDYIHKGTGTKKDFRICVAWKLEEILNEK